MRDNFEEWLDNQKEQGLQDIKFAIGGDTSNASVSKAKAEIIRLHKMAEAGITTTPPKAMDYSIELQRFNSL